MVEKPLNVELAGKGGSVWLPPKKDGNRIFFTALDGRLYCIKPDGNILWTFLTDDRIICSPTIDNGKVYVSSMDGHVYALTYEGKFLWKFRVGDATYSTPCVKNGTIYVGSINGKVYAISDRGKKIWEFVAGDEIGTGVSFLGNKIVFGSYDEYVYCLDIKGKLVWKYKTGGAVTSFGYPLEICKNLVFAPSMNFYLYAINSNGDLKWKYNMDNYIFYRIHDDLLYVTRTDGQIYCMDLEGNILWKNQVALHNKLSGTAMEDGVIYVSSPTCDLAAVSKNGVILRKKYISDYLVDMIIEDGVIYAGSNLCAFYAINANDLSIQWKFLTADQNPAEWRKVGFKPKHNEEEKYIYKSKTKIELKTTVYGAIQKERDFSGIQKHGMTTYFSESPYTAGSSYKSKKKESYS